MLSRHLDWEGSWNARDLGGLATRDGRRTRRGAIVRSESLDRLTARGWRQLQDHGVRTIVDLRNYEQAEAEPQAAPDGLVTVQVPLEQGLDRDPDFAAWTERGWLGTPLYYAPFLARWPDRCARAVAAIAGAAPGGVVVHCGMGRDRTGLVCMLLLGALGVGIEDIAHDHGLTAARLDSPAARGLGRKDDAADVDRVLATAGRARAAVIRETLTAYPPAETLRAAGLGDHELAALAERLLEP